MNREEAVVAEWGGHPKVFITRKSLLPKQLLSFVVIVYAHLLAKAANTQHPHCYVAHDYGAPLLISSRYACVRSGFCSLCHSGSSLFNMLVSSSPMFCCCSWLLNLLLYLLSWSWCCQLVGERCLLRLLLWLVLAPAQQSHGAA